MLEQLTATVPRNLAGERLDRALGLMFERYSRARLQRWIKDGCVAVDGQRTVNARLRVAGGEAVRIAAPLEDEARAAPEPMALDVVYQDDALLVVNKPPGLVVHPGAGHPRGTLVNGLLAYDAGLAALPRAGLVHRIDKDTSGLLVVARSLQAQNVLAARITRHQVTRRYLAVAHGEAPLRGSIDAPIARHARQRTRMAVRTPGKPARTHYERLACGHGLSVLALTLETGRTHQIRVHLAHIGHPIVGDRDYGGVRPLARKVPVSVVAAVSSFPRQALHATTLAFAHPDDDEPMVFESALPDDIAALVATVRSAHVA